MQVMYRRLMQKVNASRLTKKVNASSSMQKYAAMPLKIFSVMNVYKNKTKKPPLFSLRYATRLHIMKKKIRCFFACEIKRAPNFSD